MRITVTRDTDVVAALRNVAREQGVSLKEALNSAVRAGLSARRQAGTPYRTPSRSLKLRPGEDIDKALQLSADLEDAEILRKL